MNPLEQLCFTRVHFPRACHVGITMTVHLIDVGCFLPGFLRERRVGRSKQEDLAIPAGLEPATRGVEIRYSIQLSYGTIAMSPAGCPALGHRLGPAESGRPDRAS